MGCKVTVAKFTLFPSKVPGSNIPARNPRVSDHSGGSLCPGALHCPLSQAWMEQLHARVQLLAPRSGTSIPEHCSGHQQPRWKSAGGDPGADFTSSDIQANYCSLDIRDVLKRDTGTYFFRVERGSFASYSLEAHLGGSPPGLGLCPYLP
jgi:hypothetical protein